MEIEKVVHRQASTGLKLATDGEFRRSWWHFDFLAKLTGCELFHPDAGIQFTGVQTRHDAVRVIGKLDFPDSHPMPGRLVRHQGRPSCHHPLRAMAYRAE